MKNKLKNQNINVPSLKNSKQKIINDLNQKKKTSSREKLIENLNKRLNNNNSNYLNLYQMSLETTSNENLYSTLNDNNLLSNIQEKKLEKKLNDSMKDNSKKAYFKILEEVIENSDVILEILDSRDPLNCRSKEIENLILSKKDQKKIILILNKIDLIPIQNALDWQKFLSREFPCILFKSNTQNQNSHLSQSTLFEKNIQKKEEYIEKILNSNKAVGIEELLNILKNYSRTDSNIKTNINVGVIGYPNVGKSSLINSLTRDKKAGVSNTPGFTTVSKEIFLDNNIKLIDCPGIVFSNNENNVLHNVIRVEDIKDPIEVVVKIIEKIGMENVINVYELDNINLLKGTEINSEKMLYLIGEKLKKYKKGGLVDLDKVARIVISDWNNGKIKYFSCPPGIDKNLFIKQMENENNNKLKEKMIIDNK